MPVVSIDSIDDPRIGPFRNLPHSRLPESSGLFIAEGALLVQRLLASGFEVDSLFLEPRRISQYAPHVSGDAPIYVADRRLLQEIVGFSFHRGVMAAGRRGEVRSLEHVARSLPPQATLVVCDAVQDPENLGGVLRNCAAFGVDAVLLGPRCADPFSRRALRVSMGSVLQLALAESSDLPADLVQLHNRYQFELTASVLDSATPLATATRGRRTALIFGNEAHGLGDDILAHCQQRLTITMQPGIDSLNVAVTSGVFLHHFTRAKPGR